MPRRPHPSPARSTTLLAAAVLAVAAAVPVVAIVRSRSASAADAAPGDGRTAATAGASCWGIEQQYPASPDGTYWLNTPALERPQQFWCDMTTDGGGWVLVGRGREGWSFSPAGQGSARTVREAVDGPGAFAPAALDGDAVTALLGGTAVADLADGVRIERATSPDGSRRQDLRLFPAYRAWTWSLPAGQLLDHVTLDGTTYRGSNTADTAASAYGQTTNGLSGLTGTKRLFTTAWSGHGGQQGFSLGSGVSGGTSGTTNYLWTAASEGNPIPFTRVWIRPRIANDAAGFTPLPSTGLPAQPRPARPRSKPELAPWGVVGIDHTGETRIEPWNTNVLALEVVGDRTFVGGRFTGVQAGPDGRPIDQPYLAAFDLDGNWISTFRPQLDGRVWNMAVTGDGKLIVAGDFTGGLLALDPATGAAVPGWTATVARANGGRALVRGLAVHGDTIYASGSFNRVTAGTWSTITVTNAVSLSAANGNPQAWRPKLNAAAVDLAVTGDGRRVLAAGYFSAIDGDTNQGYFGITDAATGAPVPGIGPWKPSGGSTAHYQQAVADLGDRVIVGGSEHDTQLWDRDRTRLIDSHITKQGGDTQAISVFDGQAYVGCHCGDWVYQGTNEWSSPSGFRSIDPINLVGRFDTTTFAYDASWYPAGLRGAHGEGVWAIDRDQRGCLWVGGDLVRGAWSGSPTVDWLGGFARFCPDDASPPTPPSNLRAAVDDAGDGATATLTWTGSTDDSGTVSYDVYRDDRVIATVWGTSYTDALTGDTTTAHRYTVRATDARGNRSAAPAPISVHGPAPKIATVVAVDATWRYLADGTDPGARWRATGFDDGAWAAGPGRLGWGSSDLGTTIVPAGRAAPQTAYLRTSFTVGDAGAVRLLDLRVHAATGAVIWVNGVEAGRVNMPIGAITATSPAAGYVWGTQEAAEHTLSVPGSLLRTGTNVVAVELHSMTPGASRGFVDVTATTYAAGADDQAPEPGGVTARAGTGEVHLSWAAATDDTALGGYVITRDGAPVAVTEPGALGFVDAPVDTGIAHTYVVTAFDTGGNERAASPATTTAVADPNLLAFGSSWRWSFTDAGQPTGWADPGFDDRGWATGRGELGFGDGDEATVISTAPAPRPITAYFRTTVEVADPAAFQAIVADLIRDDGAVVYVNGVEIGRDNLPAGPVGPATKAPVAITDRTQERTPVTIAIDPSAFHAGTNTVAVEVHGTDRWTGDLSFDLRLTGR